MEAFLPCVPHAGTSIGAPNTSPRFPLQARSESKGLRHSVQFQLCFYLVRSSLLKLEGSLQSGRQIFKQEKMPRVADGLSVYHPPLCGDHTAPRSGARAALWVHVFYWNFCKTREISRAKDNSSDSKMKLACHAECGPQ